jgi:predicted AAA+ superfamily ATPase
MERTIQKDLLFWKSSYKRKPLLVRGARQVGKTWSIRDFGKNYFEYINFPALIM